MQDVEVRTFRSALAGLTASAKATASPPTLRAKAEGRLLHPFCNALLDRVACFSRLQTFTSSSPSIFGKLRRSRVAMR